MNRRCRVAASIALATVELAATGCTTSPRPSTSHPAPEGQAALPSTSTVPSTTTTTELLPTTTTTVAVAPEAATEPAPVLQLPDAEPVDGGTTSASWYGDESGSHTAQGEPYDPDGLTFAHRSMAFGAPVRFCRRGRCVVATCADRGPATWTGRDFDLSRATFRALAPLDDGVATVTWERLR